MDNLQAINAVMTNNFNPELLEKYSGYGGINVIRLRIICYTPSLYRFVGYSWEAPVRSYFIFHF